jgi:hypothetical protein
MEKMPDLILISLPGEFAICKLEAGAEIPAWSLEGDFFSISRTADELSIICLDKQVPGDVHKQAGWRALKVEGPFEFDEIGVLSALTEPLAKAGISLLTVSTFDTDYIFIQRKNFDPALEVLSAAGHTITAKAK